MLSLSCLHHSQKGAHAIRCTNKTADGFLYPLEKSFVFVTKVVHVAFDDIQSIEFARLQLEKKATSNQTFDMVVRIHSFILSFIRSLSLSVPLPLSLSLLFSL
eukprot:TRINITY_DN890_c0_g2_i2.p1 TRINITY_DN890_c0_g2~~TRINITY_DN890_c0_g2_i2.p1  ORF type:complete len:103 (-),score=28.13 TRINITY_DN890_c0_g2_i2:69-377(-)